LNDVSFIINKLNRKSHLSMSIDYTQKRDK